MRKFNWNEPMTKKEWGICYLVIIGLYVIWLAWMFKGTIKCWLSGVSKRLRNKFTKRTF